MMEMRAVPRPWAELRLVRGGGPKRVLFRAHEPVCFTVGSDPDNGLTIEGRGVSPAQFALAWDGTHLWLEDVLRLGRTRVNGRTLNEWYCVQGQAMVTFGSAWLVVRSAGPAPSRSAPDFDAVDRARPEPVRRLRRLDTVRNLLPEGSERPSGDERELSATGGR